MRVDPSGNRPISRSSRPRKTSDSDGSTGDSTVGNSLPEMESGFGQLVSRVEELPLTRNERISAARQQLANGDYFSREAAEETALAMLSFS